MFNTYIHTYTHSYIYSYVCKDNLPGTHKSVENAHSVFISELLGVTLVLKDSHILPTLLRFVMKYKHFTTACLAIPAVQT